MTEKKRISKKERERRAEILARLDQRYGLMTEPTLDYGTAWELLVATMLSAQCTDARVNQVTPGLFRKYPSVSDFAHADQKELEEDIHSVGFFHNKAKNLIGAAKRICDVYDGEVPGTMEDLLTLPGVGRKTANVVLGHVFHTPGIVVDTHVGRISRRLGFTKEKDPAKVEQDLMEALPVDHWISWNLQLITFGREICTSRSPRCGECPLSDLCHSPDKKADKK